MLGLYLLVRTTGNLTLFTEFMAVVRFLLVSQASASLMLGRATKPLAFAQSLLCLLAFIATKVFVNLPFTSFKANLEICTQAQLFLFRCYLLNLN